MSGTLRARLEQRDGDSGTGGLYWVQPVPEGEPLPRSYSTGGLHFVYARQAKIDAIAAARAARD
jgi:hypothetical protein